MGTEFELKYAATADIHRMILQQYGPFRKITMETTYFDTPDGSLAAQKMMLRLRRENDSTICTLKAPLAQGALGEWECPADTISQGLERLMAAGAPEAAAQLAAAGLAPVCGARFTRMAAILPTADGTAELALDDGVLLGGGRSMPLCELEVERKTGSDEATLALAEEIARAFRLRREPKSKFRRACALAQGESYG